MLSKTGKSHYVVASVFAAILEIRLSLLIDMSLVLVKLRFLHLY